MKVTRAEWETDSTGAHILYLAQEERRHLLVKILLAWIFMLTLGPGGVLFALELLNNGAPRAVGLLFVAMCLALAAIMVYAVVEATLNFRAGGWLSGRIRLTLETIEWIVPGKHTRIGRWQELQYVNPMQRILYFADGTTIRLGFGPAQSAHTPQSDLEAIIDHSGRREMLRNAFDEFGKATARRPTESRWLVVIALCVYGAGFPYFYLWNQIGLPREHSVWGYMAYMIVAIVLFWTLSPVVRRRRMVEQKHCPPRHERRRFQRV